MEYVPPVLDGHTPFFLDIHDSHINSLLSSHIIGKLNFGLGILSDTPIQIFNRIGRVNDFSDL